MNNFLHQESETLKEKGKSVSKQIDSEIINIIVILIYFRNQAHRLRDLVKLKYQLLYIQNQQKENMIHITNKMKNY